MTHSIFHPVRVGLAAFAVALLSTASPAQSAPTTLTGPTLAGEWALEQQTAQRWMHGRQRPRFTPLRSDRRWIVVDSIRAGAPGRRIHLTLGRTVHGRDSALIAVGPSGHAVSLEVGLAPFTRRGMAYPGDSARWGDSRRRDSDEGVSLRATWLWDVAPRIPSTELKVGSSWTDTIARTADDGPFHQEMRGTRVSRIIGHRVLDGRNVWLVRDSALVRYAERYPEEERTLDTTVLVSRTATGTVRGVHLYDPEVHLSRERSDTTRLSGEAVLRYPDGRTFRTPARFERTRRWELFDASRYAARMAELRGAGRRASGGMVRVPDDGLEKRLNGGDIALRDSLLLAWQRATDADEIGKLFQMLYSWGARDSASRARLERLRVAAGDTAYLYHLLAQRAFSRTPVDSADVRAMLPFMEDPSLAWSLNLSRDWLYENLVQGLTTWPRAAAEMSPSRSSVACTVPACRLLGAQWKTAREPRLRDLGLVALLSTDPARWADTVLMLAGPENPLLGRAVPLVRGVGATWPAASQLPLPSATDDWHVWLEWMDGRNPDYLKLQTASQLPTASRAGTSAGVRFEESHATAVRFFQARTGRDVVAEWRRAYDEARSDSARLVFGAMLEGVGALRLTESEVAEGFTSSDPARVTLARRALLADTEWSPMDSTAAEPFVQRLLSVIVDSGPLWPAGTADLRTSRRGSPTILHAPRGQIFVAPAGISSSIRAAWSPRVQFMTRAAWNARDERAAAVFYTIGPIQGWGRFVRVQLNSSERNARAGDQAPAVNASGVTYYLMSLNGDWVIVAMDAWVT
jgi:hypothetical protein